MNQPDELSEEPRGLTGIQIGAVAVAAALIALIALLAFGDEVSNGPSTSVVGDPAPIVQGVSYTGESFDLDSVLEANRLVAPSEQTWTVVNFYASWCTPCLMEHPDLVAFDQRTGPCRTKLVGVAINDRERDVREFFDLHGGDWPVIVGDDATGIIVGYGVTAPPETVVIAPDGLVVAKFIGAVTTADLEGLFAQAGCDT